MEGNFSERFCDPEADLTIRSSDGVHFKFYKRQLEAHSGAFAGAGAFGQSSSSEIVELSETSDVLDILFQLMSLQQPPDFRTIPFTVLSPLAEAVEKYEVFSAMAMCEIYMRSFIIQYPLEVLNYATRHRRINLMDEAALASIGLPMKKVQENLSGEVLGKWVLYLDHWLTTLTDAHRCVDTLSHSELRYQCNCAEWPATYSLISYRLAGRLASLKDLDATFNSDSLQTDHLKSAVKRWKNQVALRILNIPKFSTL